MTTRAYFCHDDGRIEELGVVTVDRLDELLTRAEQSLPTQGGFGVGLYRSERDFVQVTPVGRGQYLVYSDRIVRAAGFRALFARRRLIQPIVDGRGAALDVCRRYMQLSREAFEAGFD